MKNRGDLSTWWYWELLKEERRWGPHAMQAEGIRAEIARRNELQKLWAMWIGVVGALAGIVFGLIHLFSK
jgi:hypothetical protein